MFWGLCVWGVKIFIKNSFIQIYVNFSCLYFSNFDFVVLYLAYGSKEKTNTG